MHLYRRKRTDILSRPFDVAALRIKMTLRVSPNRGLKGNPKTDNLARPVREVAFRRLQSTLERRPHAHLDQSSSFLDLVKRPLYTGFNISARLAQD